MENKNIVPFDHDDILLCQCSFRGFYDDIEEFISSEALAIKAKKLSSDISEISISFENLASIKTDIFTLIQKYPLLKCTGFIEDFSCGEVFVFYSESGSDYVTNCKPAGSFEGQNDCGNGRWAQSHNATEKFDTRFLDMHTGSYTYVYYFFPFAHEWNRFDFARKTNDGLFTDPEKKNLTYHNGEYIDKAIASKDYYEIIDGVLKSYSGNEAVVEIPSIVEKIEVWAFKDCDDVRNIIVPEGCREICTNAFSWCSNLECITLPESLEILDVSAFEYTKLKKLYLPSGLKEIKFESLFGLGNFDQITLSDLNTEFIFEDGLLYNSEKTILYYCSPEKAGEYAMPNTVKDLAPGVFWRRKSITSVTLSENIKKIPYRTFYECENLETVNIPDELVSIEEEAFMRCKRLKGLHIPKNVSRIPHDTFPDNGFPVRIEGSPKISQKAFGDTCLEVKSPVIARQLSIKDFPSNMKKAAIRGFLCLMKSNCVPEENIVQDYIKYMKHQRKALLPDAYRNKDLFCFMVENKIITGEDLKGFENVSEVLPEVVSIIQNIIENESTFTKKKNPNSVAELKKVWAYETLSNGTLAIKKYKGMDTEVEIPSTIGKNVVTEISYAAFSPYYYPTRLAAQEHVCWNLAKVFVPDGIVNIHATAFNGCTKVVLIGSDNSYAQKFAKKENIPFEVK